MTAQNQRDPDGTDILGEVRDGLGELKANVISRWGRVPVVTSDPATLVDGMVWTRSDNEAFSWRTNDTTMSAPGGQAGSVVVSAADQVGIGGADTAITGMTITFTAVAGRRYRLSWSFGVLQSAVAGTYVCSWRLAGVVQSTIARESLAASFLHTCTGIQDLGVLGAGSKTVALSILTSSGTMTIPNLTSINGRMYIDDVGGQ